jgi:competence ComEA-like helix-hairpin-helix protein
MTAPEHLGRWSWTPRNIAALIALTAAVAAMVGWRMADRRSRMDADLVVTGAPMPAAAETIDPNTASWASLARLPGIGPGRAKAICSYRQQSDRTPAFTQPDDLMDVSGIGEVILDGIRPYLTFGEPDTPSPDSSVDAPER